MLGESDKVNKLYSSQSQISIKYCIKLQPSFSCHSTHVLVSESETYPDFYNADLKTWPRIFKLPFQVIRETKIQTFQYKILHRIICNKWLFNIKITTSEVSDYCKEIDDILLFFFLCTNIREFWNLILDWLETIRNLQLKSSQILEECIIFGFPERNILIREKSVCHQFMYHLY